MMDLLMGDEPGIDDFFEKLLASPDDEDDTPQHCAVQDPREVYGERHRMPSSEHAGFR